ncbi:hypothetical protein ABIA72_000294 [Stenotrophomonas rhizophila]
MPVAPGGCPCGRAKADEQRQRHLVQQQHRAGRDRRPTGAQAHKPHRAGLGAVQGDIPHCIECIDGRQRQLHVAQVLVDHVIRRFLLAGNDVGDLVLDILVEERMQVAAEHGHGSGHRHDQRGVMRAMFLIDSIIDASAFADCANAAITSPASPTLQLRTSRMSVRRNLNRRPRMRRQLDQRISCLQLESQSSTSDRSPSHFELL